MTIQHIASFDQSDIMTPSLAGAVLSARKRTDGRHRVYTGNIQGRRRRKFSLVRWGKITGLLLGAFRGRAVICWMDYAIDDVAQLRGVPAQEVELVALPAARLLGRMKAGVKERPSKKKAASSRRNGAMPCRPGRRRGRPRKHHSI